MITATHAPTNIVCCNMLNPDRNTICQPPFFPTHAHTYINCNERSWLMGINIRKCNNWWGHIFHSVVIPYINSTITYLFFYENQRPLGQRWKQAFTVTFNCSYGNIAAEKEQHQYSFPCYFSSLIITNQSFIFDIEIQITSYDFYYIKTIIPEKVR